LKIIEEPKYIRRLFCLCCIAYVTAMLGRLNFSAAMAVMISDGYITMTQAGFALTMLFVAYAIGQPINGALSDRYSPRIILTIGFALSIIANILLALSPPASTVAGIWFLNGFAQSMLWPAVVRLLSGYLSRLQAAKAMVNISPAVAGGTLLTYALTAGIIVVWPWQTVFWIAAFTMAVVASFCFFGIRNIERHSAVHGQSRIATKKEEEKLVPFFSLFLCSGLPIASIAVISQGILRDGITSWSPTLLSSRFYLDTSVAVLITAAIPLLGVAGVYAGHLINKRWLDNEILTAASLFGIATLALAIMAFGVGGFLFAVALMIATGLMHGINTMLISLVPLHFANKGRASSMSGLLNAFTYVGSGLSGIGIGAIATGHGWANVVLTWTIVAFVGLIACLLCAKKWKQFAQ